MKRWFYLVISVLILISSLMFIPGLRESLLNPFQNNTTISKDIKELKTLKVSNFRSSHYRLKSIFPYDFIYGSPKWGILLYKDPQFLTPEDIHNIEFYYLCKDIGVDLSSSGHFFTIITHAVAGLDIDEYLKDAVISVDRLERSIYLKTPEATLLSLEVLDNLKEDGYPNVKITPGQWQKLVILLLPKIEKEIINRGLLESADKTNRAFLKSLFRSMGWERVDFK